MVHVDHVVRSLSWENPVQNCEISFEQIIQCRVELVLCDYAILEQQEELLTTVGQAFSAFVGLCQVLRADYISVHYLRAHRIADKLGIGVCSLGVSIGG